MFKEQFFEFKLPVLVHLYMSFAKLVKVSYQNLKNSNSMNSALASF